MFVALQNLLSPTSTSTLTGIGTTTRRPNENRRHGQQLPHVSRTDLANINLIHAASLNGIASQFAQNNPNNLPVQPVPQGDQQAGELATNRKASQSNSVSQFVLPPAPATAPAPVVELTAQQAKLRPTGNTQASQVFNTQPSPTTTNLSGVAASNRQQQQQQQAASSTPGKFSFMNQAGGSTAATSPSSTSATSATSGYESTPLAATNSISHVHSQNSNQQAVNSLLASSTTSTTTMASANQGGNSNSNHNHNHNHNSNSNSNHHHNNVLASFSPPVRSHNTLASAKYSLDGIIAVAIFGGFIFLGAIITIIVIIIRR